MRTWKVVLLAVAVVLTLIVVLQNRDPVQTRVLFADVTMPRALLLLVALLAGFLAGLVVGMAPRRRRSG